MDTGTRLDLITVTNYALGGITSDKSRKGLSILCAAFTFMEIFPIIKQSHYNMSTKTLNEAIKDSN